MSKSLTKTYTIKYCIIKPFIKKIDREAISYNECKKEFLSISHVREKDLLSITFKK